MRHLIPVYLAAACGGAAFAALGMPLPWMMGPLLVSALLSLTGLLDRTLPVVTRPFGQAVVASQVGLSFTPQAVATVLAMSPLLVGLAAMTALYSLGVAVLQARLARARLSRMVLATFPISPVEAAVLAEQCDIPPAPVIMAQTLRIAAIVTVLPILIYWLDGWPQGGRPLPGAIGGAAVPGLAGLAAAAAAGGLLFRRLGWANPYFLGPLALSSALTAAGTPLSSYPPLVLATAQVVLGAWLGSTFRPGIFREAGREMAVSVAGTLLLLALSCASAAGIAGWLGLDWETAVLAVAPGGVTEMSLAARFLAQDVALVTAAHLVRIFLFMPLARPLVRLVHRRERAGP